MIENILLFILFMNLIVEVVVVEGSTCIYHFEFKVL